MLNAVALRSTLIAFACSVSVAAYAIADTPKAVNVLPGDLTDALEILARQCGVDVIYASAQLKGLRTQGVSGTLEPRAAFEKLIDGTPLVLKQEGTAVLITLPTRSPSTTATAPAFADHATADTKGDQKRSFWDRFRLAQVDQGPSVNDTAASGSNSPGPQVVRVEEVVVTAQKKQERLQDVPIPVTALDATTLSENNQTLLREYSDTIPGFTVSPGPSAGNQQMLVIRGVASQAFGNPTVGITVDDVPYGAFVRELAPDIDPSDLARVEVLRGPQGTLYGSNSMGGLVKYVTADPSAERFFGRIETGVSQVAEGDLGYSVRGVANMPVTDSFALRASAFTRENGGYIDNPRLGKDDVNRISASGGRLSALWRPGEAFSLKLSALYQKIDGDGLSEVVAAPGLGSLDQNYMPGVGQYSQETQAFSAIAHARAGTVDLTSVSGYNVYHSITANDYSTILGATALARFNVSGSPVFADTKTDRFTQELRASFFTGDALEWLLGAFYSHEKTPLIQAFDAADPATGQIVGNIQTLNIPIRNEEIAAFANLTLHFTDRFDVQIGGRQSNLDTEYEPVLRTGALFPTPSLLPEIVSRDKIFTYLVTPRFKLTPDTMLYARFASGYRPSRGNSFNPDPLVPRTAEPDSTRNYEVGAKGELLNGVISFDASVYYIEFNDIQILLLDPRNTLTYTTNGSRAKSEGVELSMEARPLDSLTVSAWIAYNNAVLTEGFPANTAAYGPSGARLPFSARRSGNLSVTQEFPISGATGFVGGTIVYMDDRVGPFIATPARSVYPEYTRLDLRAGLKLNSWTINAYANNVTDKRVVIGGGPGNFPANSYVVLQPRTIGLTLAKAF